MKDKYSKKLKVNVVLAYSPPNMAELWLDLGDLSYVIGTSFISGLFHIGRLKPGPLKEELHLLTIRIRKKKDINCLPESAACQRFKLVCEPMIESVTMVTGMD